MSAYGMATGSVLYPLAGAFRRMAYTSHGDPAAPALLCVHGLSRNGRDFDTLARALSDRFHVVAPDLPGRGGSDWLDDPMLYQVPSYVVALTHLMATLGPAIGYIGTSLGGICGMALAAMPGNPINRLVLNDIGPEVPAASLRRIRDYLAVPPGGFPDHAGLEAYLRRVHAAFGPLTDAQWAELAATSGRVGPDGDLLLHYDPAIAVPMMASEPQAIDLWGLWHAIDRPLLTLRGAASDLLLPETYARMQPKSQGLEVAGAGHAPSLADAPTIAVIRAFLT